MCRPARSLRPRPWRAAWRGGGGAPPAGLIARCCWPRAGSRSWRDAGVVWTAEVLGGADVGVALAGALPWPWTYAPSLPVPGRPATFFLATGLAAGIVSTDKRRRQDIRERLWLRLAAWDS